MVTVVMTLEVEVVKAMGEMKVGKAAGPSKVNVEIIAASGEIRIGVMVELCQGCIGWKRNSG